MKHGKVIVIRETITRLKALQNSIVQCYCNSPLVRGWLKGEYGKCIKLTNTRELIKGGKLLF